MYQIANDTKADFLIINKYYEFGAGQCRCEYNHFAYFVI